MTQLNKIPFKSFTREQLKIRVPRNMMISGQSGSGKTQFVMNLVRYANEMFNPVPKAFVYAYGKYNDAIPLFKELGVIVHEGLPSKDFLALLPRPMFLILDDMMLNLDTKYIDQLFTVDGHHDGISTALLVQNAFEKNIKLARNNCHYIVLLNSPAAKRQIRDLGVSLYPHKSKQFIKIYDSIVSQQHFEPLFIDLEPQTDEELRLRSHIFPNQTMQVYKP